MHALQPKTWLAGACLALVLPPLVGRAAVRDETGKPGKLVRLTVNTQGSEKYASYHGSITVSRQGVAQDQVYYWGGSTCPAQSFTDGQVALLAEALMARQTAYVEPVFHKTQGSSNRCLVGFSFVAPMP